MDNIVKDCSTCRYKLIGDGACAYCSLSCSLHLINSDDKHIVDSHWMPKETSVDLIKKAFAFGRMKHEGQKRDDNKEYFDAHCVPVFNILSEVTSNVDILCAGLLHDTIEDTNTSYEELCSEFNETIANLVMEVTDEGKADNYGKYFPRLKSRWGIMIKFADRLHNISSMDSWSVGRQNHYLKKSKFWKSEPPMSKGE